MTKAVYYIEQFSDGRFEARSEPMDTFDEAQGKVDQLRKMTSYKTFEIVKSEIS